MYNTKDNLDKGYHISNRCSVMQESGRSFYFEDLIDRFFISIYFKIDSILDKINNSYRLDTSEVVVTSWGNKINIIISPPPSNECVNCSQIYETFTLDGFPEDISEQNRNEIMNELCVDVYKYITRCLKYRTYKTMDLLFD